MRCDDAMPYLCLTFRFHRHEHMQHQRRTWWAERCVHDQARRTIRPPTKVAASYWSLGRRLRNFQRGEASAAELKKKFDSIPLSHIVSSPFLRCIQTVLPIAMAKGLPIKIEPGIGEVGSTGFWDAHRSASEHKFPIDLQYQPIMPRHMLQPEWGDGDAAARSRKVASAIRKNLDGPILFCGHGASCLGIAQAFSGSGYVGYSSFSHFIFDGNAWNVEAMGDASHLSSQYAKESIASAW